MTTLLRVRPALLAFVVSLLAGTAYGQSLSLDVGEAAPAFEAPSVSGDVWRSEDVVGEKILVVYFYPAAMTGGCTKQACAFRDHRSTLTKLGAEVVGVSGDRVENLKVFQQTHRLNFPLLSDTEGAIARQFGVPTRDGGTITQTIDGQEVELTRDVTTARWTFVIDREGNVAYKNTEVNPERDSEEVIAAIEALQ